LGIYHYNPNNPILPEASSLVHHLYHGFSPILHARRARRSQPSNALKTFRSNVAWLCFRWTLPARRACSAAMALKVEITKKNGTLLMVSEWSWWLATQMLKILNF